MYAPSIIPVMDDEPNICVTLAVPRRSPTVGGAEIGNEEREIEAEMREGDKRGIFLKTAGECVRECMRS